MAMLRMRWCPFSHTSATHKFTQLQNNLKLLNFTPPLSFSSNLRSISKQASISAHSVALDDVLPSSSSSAKHDGSPFSGLNEMMTGFMFGKRKATEVAHAVWKNVVRKGDVVVDATCGNGYDTLAMARMIADDTRKGCVLAMDLQKDALESTSSLLDRSLTADERGLVELYGMCHSKMEDIVPSGAAVRLVAFNLGYLPGGNKKMKTASETTLLALEAAQRILAPGGLISILAYVGHFGGREEFEKVGSFAAELPVDNWVCCKLQMLNRPSAPVLVLLSKKIGMGFVMRNRERKVILAGAAGVSIMLEGLALHFALSTLIDNQGLIRRINGEVESSEFGKLLIQEIKKLAANIEMIRCTHEYRFEPSSSSNG